MVCNRARKLKNSVTTWYIHGATSHRVCIGCMVYHESRRSSSICCNISTYPHLNILDVRLDWFCCTKTSFSSLGWAWACPTLIMTMALVHEIIIYLSIYHLPRICRSLVPEIRVRPKMHLVFSEYWCAYMHDLQWLNSKDDWSYSHLPWRLSMKTGGRMHRHMV